MEKISWGIIGCGDVAEVKSGPAFQQCKNSELVAVMRRNGAKAKDFAERHKVPNWYDNAEELLARIDINAVYIATPPASHLKYTLQAIAAGKDIYLEKPMTISENEAIKISETLKNSSSKLTVAHYRRKLPAFLKVKELLANKEIGEIRVADIQILRSHKNDLIAESDDNWRVDPSVSGGGLFHDLAPHQLDLMYHYFGDIESVKSFSDNQSNLNSTDDVVNGIIHFKNGVQFRGVWSFSVSEESQLDRCIIYGSQGNIEFPFFGDQVILNTERGKQVFEFESIPHVQQPMIQETVNYFLGTNNNPCTAEEGLVVMKLLDAFTQ
ncbi:Gfo/Idh/MocA family protein [Zunongwangia sp.]|uniref:Gfo/Idh/MocA family protein n=1 Tax=Zunongwangia sp. TaxID=1965325 RepID=UPI003AA8AAD0